MTDNMLFDLGFEEKKSRFDEFVTAPPRQRFQSTAG